MRARITLLLFAILYSFTCLAQTNFEKHFTKKSVRIDFALSGNWDFQAAAIQQLREEPVWAGPVKNLIDPFGYGGYYINVYDKAGKELIYSRGFNTLFEEWRSTEPRHNLGQIASLSPIRKLLSSLRLRQETRPTCSSIFY